MLGPHVRLGRLDAPQLSTLARGCALLGSGGGGDPAVALTSATCAVRTHGPVEVVAVQELPDEVLVMPCGQVGSAFVANERLWGGEEGRVLRDTVERLRGVGVGAVMPFEIGGANGLLAVLWAARVGLPLADADGMGRTFPALHQQAMHVAGVPASPVVVTDGRGNVVIVEADDDAVAGRLVSSAVAGMGGVGAAAVYTMTAGQARGAAVTGSLSRAYAVGQTPREALTVLIEGRVTDLERRSDGASATVRDGPRRLRLELRGEYLLAIEDGVVVAAVPDVICVLGAETGEPVAAQSLRRGWEVTVVTLPAPVVWRSGRGLALVGPSAFGYDVHPPRSNG
jgi:DUF917 family protein